MNKQKHHYLPRHYLRGFTDSAGGFFVYDKKSGKIFFTRPDAAFFENDLNTVTFPDGISPSDFLESLYCHIENQAWPSLGNIRNSTAYAPIELQDKMELFLFLSFLHWRLPGNTLFTESLSQHFFGSEQEVGFVNLKNMNGTTIPQKDIDRFKNSPMWKKTARLIAPFAPFYNSDSWWKDLENWRFVYTADGKSWNIVGDNPIINRGVNDHDPTACLKEFIFPVSGSILLISCGEHIDKTLPAKFTIQYGSAIIERSQRFVACHDKSFLEALLSDYELHAKFGKTDDIVPELFHMAGSHR